MSRLPPSTEPPDPARHLPSDWPLLWQAVLDARASASCAGTDLLAFHPDDGWQLVGRCSPGAAALFGLYKPLLDARRRLAGAAAGEAWLLAQLGQSLDGCVATAGGDSYFVTGPESLLHLHRLRALSDAVLVGAGTVAADDPQLTTRRVPGPQPVRVVLDPAAGLDGRARVFTDRQAPSLWVCDADRADAARERLAVADPTDAPAAEVLAVPGLLAGSGDPGQAGLRIDALVEALVARGLRLLFIEGGGITVSRFMNAGALDRLHLAIAPVLIGAGRRGLQGPARQAMADCPRPPAQVLALGQDMLWDLALREPSR